MDSTKIKMHSLDLGNVFSLNKKENPAIVILENKIKIITDRGFEEYNLTIRILRDLIREIKEL
jgi:hypothetical protein